MNDRQVNSTRTLNEDYRLRVVIDGSPGALEPMLFRTKRQSVLEIGAKLPQLQTLLALITRFRFNNVVWRLLGGVPVDYEELDSSITRALDTDPSTVQSAVGECLRNQIYQAVDIVNEAKIHSDIDQILELVDEKICIPVSELVSRKLKRPTPDQVLREVEMRG